MTELLPCPFCGGEAVICSGGYGDHSVYCSDCIASTRTSLTKGEAIAAWNTRAERTCRDEGGIGSKFPAAFVCSECGWCSTVFAFGKDSPRYCPNCGAKVVCE